MHIHIVHNTHPSTHTYTQHTNTAHTYTHSQGPLQSSIGAAPNPYTLVALPPLPPSPPLPSPPPPPPPPPPQSFSSLLVGQMCLAIGKTDGDTSHHTYAQIHTYLQPPVSASSLHVWDCCAQLPLLVTLVIPHDLNLKKGETSLGTRRYTCMRRWVWLRPIEGFVPGATKLRQYAY